MHVIAQEVGYRALCFGRIGLTENTGDPFALRRVAVKQAMSHSQFEALLHFDGTMIRQLRRHQAVRDLARQILGRNAYLGVRRLFTMGRSHR